MELSDDLFEDLRKTLGLNESGGDGAAAPDGSPAAAAANAAATRGGRSAKRRASRSDASRARAELEFPGTLAARKRVTLIDLSRGGVSFFDNRAWSAGETLVMHLPRSPEQVIPLLCTVRNSRMVDGWFRVGVEFVSHYEAVGMVLRDPVVTAANTPAPTSDPGRRAPRKRFNRAAAPAQLHTYEMETAGQIVEADVVDLSDGGVGLVCSFQLPPGRKIMVRLTPPGGKTMTRMCEVVSCRRNDTGGYRLGTRFIEYKPSSRSLPQMLVGLFRGKS